MNNQSAALRAALYMKEYNWLRDGVAPEQVEAIIRKYLNTQWEERNESNTGKTKEAAT